MKRILKPDITAAMDVICPVCGEPMEQDRDYGLGWCRNTTCLHYYREDDPIRLSSEKDAIFRPMIDEGKKHLDEDMMRRELDWLGIDKQHALDFGVGYYPPGYWVNRNEESKFGTVLFPMEDWRGNIVNILAKDIGRDEKLDLAKAVRLAKSGKWFGIFNAKSFWVERVHVFWNPTACLRWLCTNEEPAICVAKGMDVPPLFPLEEAVLHPLAGHDYDWFAQICHNNNVELEIFLEE